MKQKRVKAYRKQMGYYQVNFKFREPYQVLVDEEIILECIKTKFDLVAGLKRTVQGEVKPMITQCAMEALYRANNQDAIELARTFERRRCGHIPRREGESEKEEEEEEEEEDEGKEQDNDKKGPLSAFDCIKSVTIVKGQNKHRYVVATQKLRLRQLLRHIPAAPLIYMSRSVMILEPMSPATEQMRARIEQDKLTQGLNQTEEKEETVKRKRGPKEPNPLSVKKRAPESSVESSRKRRRRHARADPVAV